MVNTRVEENMDPDLVKSIFSFGLKVAEHVHGVRRGGNDNTNEELFKVIRAVAAGELTLLGTPEETIASLPKPPPGVKLNIEPAFLDMMRVSRENERFTAKIVEASMPN